jgi:hypothetical protein
MAKISHQASNEILGWVEMKKQGWAGMKWLKHQRRQAMKYDAREK